MWFVVSASVALGAPPVLITPPGLTTTRADPPKFQLDPSAAPARCVVRIAIDESGVPTEVQPRGCPDKFAAAAKAAVLGWRWVPVTTADGAPARVLTLVAIEFTGVSRLPVGAPPRCSYALKVSADGAVTVTGDDGPQCEIWPPSRVAGPIPAVGACAVGVDPLVPADDPRRFDVTTCPPDAVPLAQTLVAESLFATGSAATRVAIDLPDAVAAPTARTIDVGTIGDDPMGAVRLGAGGTQQAADPTLDVSNTAVPTVDLSDLKNLKRAAPKPAPPPPPAPAPAAPAPA
ncbi:MAG: hypothetical protein ABMB14_08980, partial [Myxococcota bacterium]